ncbi:Transforming growth factor beta-1-induced transcript 1 protein [Podila humilis]|nr:Transforming growth factor beta-1-induced transcript 1 protein [Podila humilis]
MAYITKDQLTPAPPLADLYLQKVNGQSSGPGATGTTKSRSTLNGPRPPTFKASSRKIFQNDTSAFTSSVSSPIVSSPKPTSTQLETIVKSLSLYPAANPTQRPSSPILESMGEAPPAPAVMESMGSDGHEPVIPAHQPLPAHSAPYGTFNGHGYNAHAGSNWPMNRYGTMPPHLNPQHSYYNTTQQQQQSVHLSEEQYMQLQRQQYLQQQEYLRQQHASHAAAHGYLPTPATGQSLVPSNALLQQPATPATQSKTISPRIVPIVPIPKYTVVVPPKTEIETLDDDWAPESPPQDPPKAIESNPPSRPPSRPRTPILPPRDVLSASSISDISLQAEQEPQVSSESTLLKEEDRIPLPPPREFRRKSVTPPLPPTPVNRPTPSFFIPGSTKDSTSTTPSTKKIGSAFTKTSGSGRVDEQPAPGSVRANAAKFDTLTASHGTASSTSSSHLSSPRTCTSKAANSVAVSATDVAATATTNPWTTRKALENRRRNSLSKGSGATMLSGFVPKSRRLSENYPSSVIVSKDKFEDKELPPIRNTTLVPQTGSTANGGASVDMGGVPFDVDYDSKCVLTDEHKEDASLPAPPAVAFVDSAVPAIPLAEEDSKEILITSENTEERSRSSSPTTQPIPAGTPRTSNSDNASSGNTNNPSGFICSSCNEPISGMMITAMGKRWHSDHFVCCICDTNLEHVQFFQKDGRPYCHLDYHVKFSPKCGHCNSAIENVCHIGFDSASYYVENGKPYCQAHYKKGASSVR